MEVEHCKQRKRGVKRVHLLKPHRQHATTSHSPSDCVPLSPPLFMQSNSPFDPPPPLLSSSMISTPSFHFLLHFICRLSLVIPYLRLVAWPPRFSALLLIIEEDEEEEEEEHEVSDECAVLVGMVAAAEEAMCWRLHN